MARRTITGITVADENKRAKFVKEGITIDGKKHRLLSIPLGTRVVLKTTSKFIRTYSIDETYEEFKDKIKWIYGTRDENSGEWEYISWEGKKWFPIEINNEQVFDYADEPLVAIKCLDPDRVGKLYWLEAFINAPEFPEAASPKGIFVVFNDAPFIKKGCFSRKSYCDFTKEEQNNIPVINYGEPINLFLRTYKLADPSLGYHNYGVFKVTVYSTKTGTAVSEEQTYIQESDADPETFLATTRISLLVDKDWREKVGHEENTEESFYVEVKPFIAENKNAQKKDAYYESLKNIDFRLPTDEELEAARKSGSLDKRSIEMEAADKDIVLVTYKTAGNIWNATEIDNKRIAKNAEYTETALGTYSSKKEHYFRVPYSTNSEIIQDRNNKVSDQMVSIKDTEYECAPNDYSCKFTEISIKDPDRTEEVIIFQEIGDGSVDDSTHIPFDIIAGDKEKKELTISLCDLEHAGSPVECLKIGRHHENAEAVWGMDEAIRQIQWLKEDDVDIKENILTLKLMYHYNKTYDTRAQKWLGDALGRPLNKIVDYGWVIRYLDIWNVEKQSYFIPVSTCRYPNQKLHIECWPDVEWYVNFKFNTDKPVYVKQSKEYKSRPWDTSVDKFKRGAEYGRERSQMKNRASYLLGVDMGIILNGTKLNIVLSNDHPIFRMANFTLMAYEKLNELLQCDLSKTKMNEAANSSMTKRTKRSLPLRIELKRPAFSAGVRARYAVSTTTPQAMGWFIEGVFKASPLFAAEGRLDLLFFAKFIPVAGQVIEGIQKVVDGVNLLTFGAVEIDYYIDLVVGTAVDLSIEDLGYHSVDKWQGPGINLKQSFEIGLEAGGSVTVDMFDVQGIGMIHGSGMAKFSVNIAYNDRDQSCPAQFDFEGLEALVYVRFSIKRKKGKKGGGNTPDATPTKVPVLSEVKGPKIELFKF